MSDNLYQAYVVGRWRRVDALRDAEQWRLARSVNEANNSPGCLQWLALRLAGFARAHPHHEPSDAQAGTRPMASKAA